MPTGKYSMRCAKKYILLLAGICLVIVGVLIIKQKSARHCVNILGDSYSSYIQDSNVVFPLKEKLSEYKYDTLFCLYEMYTRTLQHHCKRLRRFGEIARKGWYVCLDFLEPAPHNCSVVSANSVFDESVFVRHIEAYCRCEHHKYEMNEMESGFTKTRTFDLFTFSITKKDDLVLLRTILKSDGYNVRQFLIEIHSLMYFSEGVKDLISVLQILYQKGFRLAWFDIPYRCVPLHNNRASNCINLNFVRVSSGGNRSKSKENSNLLLLPSSQYVWKKLSRVDLAISLYHEYLSTVQFHCKHIVRMGKINDGGWDICHDFMSKSQTKSPCIVYSFGIENDFSFDDDISNTYGCQVYSFDPSMGVDDHQRSDKVQFFNKGLWNSKRLLKRATIYWSMDTFEGIRKQLKHVQTPIKILKMDIERSEWIVLKQIIDNGLLENVEQFLVEFHSMGDREKLFILKSLYDIGFRIFWFHKNPLGSNYKTRNIPISSANEVSFINVVYLRKHGML
ncbi:uncharacterized protein LOC133192934 [Saccostrea echinata]|uniref:uncharacterized protein LOC133192934 n=1 Tax=Saccostrea echinata TaxID=191078 RepID=UPI002A7EAFF9|nr:uncharacterized protein LOC133192934 [Saccostrea echinata]